MKFEEDVMQLERQFEQRQETTLNTVDDKVRKLLSGKNKQIQDMTEKLKSSEKMRGEMEQMIRDLNSGLFSKSR
jgi:hypothetical protein